MTRDQWKVIAGLIDEWWPGRFEKTTADAWFTAVADRDGQDIINALKALLERGQVHRPSLGELVAQLRHDPSRPTFDEMLRLVYGVGGVLRARPARNGSYGSPGEKTAAYEQAALDRAGEMSPWILGFVQRYGIERLRMLELDHEDYGPVRRRELEGSWQQFLEATEGRSIAALTAGRRGGMARLDPFAVLGAGRRELAESMGSVDPGELDDDRFFGGAGACSQAEDGRVESGERGAVKARPVEAGGEGGARGSVGRVAPAAGGGSHDAGA